MHRHCDLRATAGALRRSPAVRAHQGGHRTGDAGTSSAGPGRQAGGRPFRARHPGGPLAAGTGLLLVRPTGVQICPADDAGHHLTGTVADVAFRGRGYDHAIDVPGQGRLTGVFSPARAGRGERVGLRFDPDGCHVFAPPEPGPADPGGPVGPPGQVADGQGAPGRAAAAAGPRVT